MQTSNIILFTGVFIEMLTYQDLLAVGKDESQRMDFIQRAIGDHKGTKAYRLATDAELYYRHLNPTIMRYEKLVYDVFGKSHPDVFAANHKIPCRYYYYLINQGVMYLLSNGVSFSDEKTKDALGGVEFDHVIIDLTVKALNAGVCFGFLNVDHVELLPISGGPGEVSFVPLFDEDNGALMAGIRFWQVDKEKPLRCTLFEVDGMTEYIKKNDAAMAVLSPKRAYKLKTRTSAATGTEIYAGENWASLPIVPLYNTNRQSELIGTQETIDSYDLMLSDMINNVSEGNLIYWLIKNAGGMDDIDDQKFIERLKTVHVAHTEEGQEVTPVTVQAPYQANETSLERLRKQLFEDFMALDVQNIAGGAATATQIQAAYEPMNLKSGLLERQVTAFILGLLKLLGIQNDAPTYTRDMIVNKQEEAQVLLSAADYVSEEYLTEKLLTIFGDIDRAKEVKAQRLREDTSRHETPKKENENDENEETVPEAETMEE